MNDLKLAFRQLLKNPGFAGVAILTLILGIGATTAIFSVVYAVVLNPLPFPDSDRLVAIWTRTPQVAQLRMAAANQRDLKAQSTVFEDIAILRNIANYNLTGDGEPERLLASRITPNLFSILRAQPALGRNITEEELLPGHEGAVVILSHALWQRRYGGNPNIVGKTILLEHYPHVVIGVMGPDFRYPSSDVQIWTPLTLNPADLQNRTGYHHLCVARLKPGATVEQAQNEANLIAEGLAQQYPNPNKDVRFTVVPLKQDIAGVARKPLLVLLGAAMGLLLIGCCNLVNLLLARALARSRETAVRAALGASQFQLFRQSAEELLPILALGLLGGVLAARWGVKLIVPWLPPSLPTVAEIAVNLPVLLFSGTMLALTATLILFLPTLQSRCADLITSLREDSRTSSTPGEKVALRNFLVVGQISMTVMLLTGAGLLIRSFATLREVNPGFHPEGVLTVRLAISRNRYGTDDEVAALCQRILEQARALPGVTAAGMGNRLPLDSPASGLSTVFFERTDRESGALEATDETCITPDYFRAMRIPLLQGRQFTEQDGTNAPLVVIVDERVARLAWPGESPIGKRIRSNPGAPWAEVVGVAAFVRYESLENDQRLQIYWNYHQRARDRTSLVVRTTTDPRLLIQPVLGAIKAVDPDQPAYALRTMTDVVDRSLSLRWFNSLIISFFAASSLLLAILGIYGVISWNVQQRTREIGVRMALGAQRQSVLALVLGSGVKLASTGIALGLVGAVALTQFLKSLLFGISPTDPLTFTLVPLALIIAALLACWIPARHAAMVDPMEALRNE